MSFSPRLSLIMVVLGGVAIQALAPSRTSAQPFTADTASAVGLDLEGNKDGGLSWADFNGDGCLDLAVNTQQDADCDGNGDVDDESCGSRIFMQNAFTASSTCSATWTDVTACLAPRLASTRGSGDQNERTAIWGDLNGDGHPDLIVNTAGNSSASTEQSVEVWLNNGSGTTSNNTNGSLECGAGVLWSQFGGARNGGVLASAGSTPSITIDGRSSGSATAPLGALQHVEVVGDGSEELNSEMVAFADYDSDGDLDIFIDNHGNGMIVLRNAPDAGDGTANDWDLDDGVDNARDDSFCNNDDAQGGDVVGFPFSCDEATGLPHDDQSGADGDYGTVADLDRDGDIDAVLRKQGGNEDLYLSDNSNEAVPDSQPYDDTIADVNLDSASNGNKGGNAPCDFDSDGDFDFFWTENGVNRIWEQTGSPAGILANGSGSFAINNADFDDAGGTNPVPGTGVIDGVACPDWDNDGDLDLHLSNSVGDFFFENTRTSLTAAGTFVFSCVQGPSGLCTNNTSTCVTASGDIGCGNGEAIAYGDTDRDGDLDLVLNQDGCPSTPQCGEATADTDPNEYWSNITDSAANDVGDNYLMVEALWDIDGTAGGTTRAAIGATITLSDCDGNLRGPVMEVNGARGHGSQNPAIVHFGLPDLDGVGVGTEPEDLTYVVRVEYTAVHPPSTDDSLIVGATVVPSGITGYQLVTITSTDGFVNGCPTPALVAAFSEQNTPAGTLLQWETAAEVDTLTLQLFDQRDGMALTDPMLALTTPEGTFYEVLIDPNNAPTTYWLKEETVAGKVHWHGPITPTREALDMTRFARLGSRLEQLGPTRYADATSLSSRQEALGAPSQWQRIRVTETGLQALPLATLAGLRGVSETHLFKAFQFGQLRLRRGLDTVPVRVHGDRVLFYGEASTDPIVPHSTYWLEPGAGVLMPTGTQSAELFFDDFETGTTQRWDGVDTLPSASAALFNEQLEESGHLQTIVLQDPFDELIYWDYLFTGIQETTALTFEADHVLPGTLGLELHFRGADSIGPPAQQHSVNVELNGTPIGTADWSGAAPSSIQLAVPDGVLLNGANTLALEQLDIGQGQEFLLFDKFDLSYRRSAFARDGVVRLTSESAQRHQLRGFGDAAIVAIDISNPAAPIWRKVAAKQDQGGDYGVALQLESNRTLLAVQRSAELQPTIENAATPTDVEALAQGAEYLVIYGPGLADGAEQLAERRSNQGLQSVALNAQAIYDHYTGGNVDPRAIRSLIRNTEPTESNRYVVLVGQGHRDYRDVQGYGGNLLPPMLAVTEAGLLASDRALLEDPLGGQTAIGRIPVVHPEELTDYIADLAAYELSADFDAAPTLSANDRRHAEGDFRASQDGLLAKSRVAWDVIDAEADGHAQARNDLLTALDTHDHLFLSYSGHGGVDRLTGPGLLTTGDLVDLDNADPILFAMTCNAARFDFATGDTLGEAWVKLQSGGIAFFGSVGLSDNSLVPSFGSEVYAALYDSDNKRLGDVLIAGHKAATDLDEMELTYQLLGDPALRIRP